MRKKLKLNIYIYERASVVQSNHSGLNGDGIGFKPLMSHCQYCRIEIISGWIDG